MGGFSKLMFGAARFGMCEGTMRESELEVPGEGRCVQTFRGKDGVK